MSRSAGKRLALLALCALLALLFTGLGIWQVERLQWKRDLIARVDARLAAPPVGLSVADFPRFADPSAEYTKVRITGRYDHAKETLVDALTTRGKGFWVMTPLAVGERNVLVNRGFVLADAGARATAARPAGIVTVTGLVRPTEPKGRFLRANEPAAGRWFSRDVAAIAQIRGIVRPAPFFIDADATPNAGGLPIGGLTVVQFRNSHLVYALTWFALALLSLGGLVLTAKSANKGH